MDYKELKERQDWSLEKKIDHSLGAIEEFYERLGGKVYIGFSGGKDSTVLLWLARKLYPDIVRFVRETREKGANIDIIYPKMKPKEVMAKFGFPLVSKETSSIIYDIRYNPESVRSRRALGLLETSYKGKVADKWKWLIDEDFGTSAHCCRILKKETGLAPILGVMAEESNQRTTDYINRGGCNVFGKQSKSLPLSIWTEQDI